MRKEILAAFIFFTRIPSGNDFGLEPRHFDRAINWWPIIGFATGGFTALLYWTATLLFPPLISIIIALAFRLLLTGALHDDGLADFCDGFGCSTDKNRILAVMKDSSIGTYGVLALIFYYLLIIFSIASLPILLGVVVLFASDVWSKFCSSLIVYFLPYAREREQSKSRIIYESFSVPSTVIIGLISALPVVLLWWPYALSAISPLVSTFLLLCMMKTRIGGYTGDCCGALFMIGQLTMILTVLAIYR